MPVTNYHTVNGRLIGETTAGVRTDYLTDALGSITATVNQSAQIVNTYRYKPFGERLAKTGSGSDPRFQFTGDTGSVTTSRRYAENYNRHRSLDVKNGRWGSVDPIWPGEAAYAYTSANPTTYIDPMGLQRGSVAPPLPPRPTVPPRPGPRPTPRPGPNPGHSGPLPEHAIFLTEPTGLALTGFGIKSIVEEIIKLFTGPDPETKCRPKTRLERCQEDHFMYSLLCPNSKCKLALTCSQAWTQYFKTEQCLELRQRVLTNCDWKSIPGWTPKDGHLNAVCASLMSHCKCARHVEKLCNWERGGGGLIIQPTPERCAQWKVVCGEFF